MRGRLSASKEKTTRSAYRGCRLLSTSGGSWTCQTTTGRSSFGTSGRSSGYGAGWWSCYGGSWRSHECPPCFIGWWYRQSSFWGRDLGFVGGNVQEAGGGTCRFPKADNRTEVRATEERKLAAGGSREVPWEVRKTVPGSLYLQESDNSARVGDGVSNIGGLRKRHRLQGMREALGDVVEEHGD